MAKKVTAEFERVVMVSHPASPERMDEIAQQPGFLRFQFQHKNGQWENHFPLVSTRRALEMVQQEPPLTRAVFEDTPPAAKPS